MPYEKPQAPEAGRTARRSVAVLVVVVLIAAAAAGSYLYARRDAAANRDQADRRGAEVAQLQDQLRSAAKQNDYLAEQVRQGSKDLTNAGHDSQSKEHRLRSALRDARRAQAKADAKLKGLASGLSGSVGTVHYVPPTKKGSAGLIEGSVTITNSAAIPLSAVCVVDVGTVAYAITSHAIPPGGSVLESFRFAYAGAKPSGVSSGGCGRM
jgi:type II secretory pathway pseudopilin PulG